MRRRSLVDLAHIAELVWSARLARWVERQREDESRLQEALDSQPPRTVQAAAVWEKFAEMRQRRIEELEELLAASLRGVVATRRRLRVARARRRAAARVVRRRSARRAAGQREDELEAWLVRSASSSRREEGDRPSSP